MLNTGTSLPIVARGVFLFVFEQMEEVLQTLLVFSLQTYHGLHLEVFCCVFC